MASVMTHADSIREYLTGASSHFGAQSNSDLSLGNHQSSTEIGGMSFNVSSPIANISVDFASAANSTGAGTLTVTGSDMLKWTPPGGGQGNDVTILNGESKVVEGTDLNMYVRISRTSATALTGTATVTISEPVNNVFGFDNVSAAEAAAGDTEYRAACIENVSSVAVTSVKVKLKTLGTQQVSGVTQLPASGAGTIVTAGSFSTWPNQGYAMVKTSGGSVRESIYYTSRTATALTVPAAGRALQGTSAAAGAASDTVDAIPSIAIAKEAPSSQPSGSFQTIANESTAPTAVTFSQPLTDTEAISIGTLNPGEIQAVWMRRVMPAGSATDVAASNQIRFTFDAS